MSGPFIQLVTITQASKTTTPTLCGITAIGIFKMTSCRPKGLFKLANCPAMPNATFSF